MNRIYKLSMLAVVMIFTAAYILGFTSPALAQDVQVLVNGQTVQFDQKPYINKDGRTMVPVRAPMEAAGATVTWDDTQKSATVKKDTVAAVFKAGYNQYTVNGNSKKMDTTAQIVNGRTCFPIRFVAEALGLKVDWDQGTRTVKITEQAASTNQETPTVNNPVDPKTEETKQPVDSTQKPMTSLTPEAKARLMAYPYPVDKNGKQYEIIRKMIEDKEYGQKMDKDILEIMQEPLSLNQVVKTNQRFVTDADLCYSSRNPGGGSRIRGILQTTNQDGTITEQDIEYGFSYGTVFVKPGDPTIPSHWFGEYETVQLSSPITVK